MSGVVICFQNTTDIGDVQSCDTESDIQSSDDKLLPDCTTNYTLILVEVGQNKFVRF
jgi:hypothetical protein